MTLDTIDKINAITTGQFAVAGGDEAAMQEILSGEGGPNWEEISGYLYQLLACIIKGNHTNCAQFAQPQRLDWLFGRLGSQQASEGTGNWEQRIRRGIEYDKKKKQKMKCRSLL